MSYVANGTSANVSPRACLQKVQGRPDAELVAAARGGALRALQVLGARGWTLAALDALPFGLAAPLHEALQLLRDCPPPGARAAYVVVSGPRAAWARR
jgi:hypothetical protein